MASSRQFKAPFAELFFFVDVALEIALEARPGGSERSPGPLPGHR
jgi:hypothetical protein